MAGRTTDSMPVKMWMKNIWVRQTIKNYLPAAEPEYAQHLRDGDCGQPQVNGSQHSQEAEHRLVNVVLSLDDK